MSTLVLNDTFSGKNISSAASVYDYTVLTAGAWRFQVALTNAAGNGDYILYLKRQRGGSGTARPVLPKTTATAASGETDFEAATITVDLSVNDIVSVFVDGLAGDTSVSGLIEGWRDDYNTTTPPTASAIASQVDTTLSGTHGSGTWADSGAPPSAATISDAVWDEAISGHLAAGSTGAALNSASATTAAAVADAVWDELLSGHAITGSTGAALSSAAAGSGGGGAITFTYTLTDSVISNPIADAAVEVYTDIGMTAITASGRTDNQGQVVFYLDAGTYYFKRVKSGYTFANPDTEVVS